MDRVDTGTRPQETQDVLISARLARRGGTPLACRVRLAMLTTPYIFLRYIQHACRYNNMPGFAMLLTSKAPLLLIPLTPYHHTRHARLHLIDTQEIMPPVCQGKAKMRPRVPVL
jgi:hypothetical protein